MRPTLRLLSRLSLLAAVLALSTGCAVRKIPGTEIDDTAETREVLSLINQYRIAFEKRSVSAILEVTDEAFSDNGGTVTPDDDLDRVKLASALPARFSRIDDVRLDINVRRVEYDESGGARVTYTYALSFRMPQYSQRTQTETDIKQMVLRRGPDARWRILSGI